MRLQTTTIQGEHYCCLDIMQNHCEQRLCALQEACKITIRPLRCFIISWTQIGFYGQDCPYEAPVFRFLADRTIGRAFGTVSRLSVVCRLSVCNVLYCGKTVHPSEKVSEGVNRKPGSKSSFFGSPPYFYFRFRRYGHRDGRFCLIFARTAKQSVLDGRN